jgi:ribonucleoside-diphosphate reductase alpha chain
MASRAQVVARAVRKLRARRRLPNDRQGMTKRIWLRHPNGELKIYIQTGEYPDGSLGEIFIKGDRAGSTISGLLDALSVTASVALQYGVPVETLIDKWSRMQFLPAGTTSEADMPRVSSIVDAVARWLTKRYAKKED